MDIYRDCKIYGPYQRVDGRKHIIAIFPDGTRKTVSFPKYLMEKQLGRFLEPNETVDHKDQDYWNDDPSNLVIKDRSKHIAEDAIVLKEQQFVCPSCEMIFELKGIKLSHAITERKRGKLGPFCSRSCSGKYYGMVRSGKIIKGSVKLIEPIYYTNKMIEPL